MKKGSSILAGVLIAGAVSAQTSHARAGNKFYKEGKFDKALFEYQQALQQHPSDPSINYNLGDAYFRNEKYDDAEKTFDIAIAGADTPALRERSFYNKGVALSRQNKLEESINAYKSALLIDPSDEDARINLQKALLEKKNRQRPEQDSKETQKQNNRNKEDRQPPSSESTLTKKQVEQLLKALQQREQQVQQKMLQNRGRATTKPDKDW